MGSSCIPGPTAVSAPAYDDISWRGETVRAGINPKWPAAFIVAVRDPALTCPTPKPTSRVNGVAGSRRRAYRCMRSMPGRLVSHGGAATPRTGSSVIGLARRSTPNPLGALRLRPRGASVPSETIRVNGGSREAPHAQVLKK